MVDVNANCFLLVGEEINNISFHLFKFLSFGFSLYYSVLSGPSIFTSSAELFMSIIFAMDLSTMVWSNSGDWFLECIFHN